MDQAKPCLVTISDEGLGEVYRLNDKTTYIGSHEDSDLILKMRGVGEKHALIKIIDNEVFVTALEENLVLMADEGIRGSTRLREGAKIEIGIASFKFRFFDDEDERYHKSLRQLAIRDGLTELYNARFFSDALSKEHEYGFRKGSSLALVFMDIDHFKEINDRFGHAFGDFVLKSLAELLTTKIRGYDLLARYGGEEFVFLVREESEASVGELAFRICNDIRGRVFNHAGIRAQITVSIGYHWWNGLDRNVTAEDLLRLADDNLYIAKGRGRDQVVPGKNDLIVAKELKSS